ncbi:hypothetical protein EHS25_005693 [Saitozyma podzolica]|uniref:Uncharacterized protein n=1 Tax=Saitozyma podzolica TaxID=1890683 RepID=A0A427XVV0_9TREE|nr:hypothetical protein EHS25_005693 [Saitozyma podzolica]
MITAGICYALLANLPSPNLKGKYASALRNHNYSPDPVTKSASSRTTGRPEQSSFKQRLIGRDAVCVLTEDDVEKFVASHITTNDAVGLTEDLADLLDQRADLAHELLLAQLLLGKSHPGNRIADGLDLVKHLGQALRHLLGELLVCLRLLALLLFLGRFLELRDVLNQREVPDSGALAVHNLAIAINLRASADADFPRGQFANKVSSSSQTPPPPSSPPPEDVAILVTNVAVLIDKTAKEDLWISADQTAHDVATGRHDLAVLGDRAPR